ncbi:hypothetical protein M2451_002052 [Dysgonomonas sp. PFB1-18]|uniref:DUF4294 domain-containing protein n=1 Tax=unclassified Dysgonomonas TaxID=2630389 RepID=UPI00247596AD|nr:MULTISPECIES: DUF4294 domain-containing protein [unclassified Dysgonomonas]MDH6309764.1 hypothetical protein [Dysgonomonas sp. PF1-14]MDH6339228.1 hypothetical protein [Dysgonomonas sp. PF1-16]MDH6380727.1 hypothetical protein [Dysgonomonas sp. PFB1-18]MDH6398223.1 hypothetical protein [Dysgonomonas sp. PF1-23]
MKRIVLILCILLLFSATVWSQDEKPKTYIDMAAIYEGDTIAMFALKPVYIFAPIKFKNNKERQEYTKLVRDVKKAYPYARMIASSIIETYEYMETIPTEQAKQKYLEDVQKYMMAEYKPQMKKMTKNQGKILVKLIDRECNTPSYNIVKALVGSFKASVYNAFAGLFGNSLKSKYDPDDKDAAIEAIVLQIEQGTVDYYYSVNYHGFKK